MSLLITADWHLTDTNYKKDFISWLLSFDFQETISLIIVGDLVHDKDNHSAELVYFITNTFKQLSSKFTEIYILKGNHDYKTGKPIIFKYLELLNNVFIIENAQHSYIKTHNSTITFIPHDTLENLPGLQQFRTEGSLPLLFFHNDIINCVYDNQTKAVTGIPSNYFNNFKGEVFAGHFHKPQEYENFTIIGSPYTVNFPVLLQNQNYSKYEGNRLVYIDNNNNIGNYYYKNAQRKTLRINANNYKNIIFQLKNENYFLNNDEIKIVFEIDNNFYTEFTKISDSILTFFSYLENITIKIIPFFLENKEKVTIKEQEYSQKNVNDLIRSYAIQNKKGFKYIQTACSIVENIITENTGIYNV